MSLRTLTFSGTADAISRKKFPDACKHAAEALTENVNRWLEMESPRVRPTSFDLLVSTGPGWSRSVSADTTDVTLICVLWYEYGEEDLESPAKRFQASVDDDVTIEEFMMDHREADIVCRRSVLAEPSSPRNVFKAVLLHD